jgi:hypothetical protein
MRVNILSVCASFVVFTTLFTGKGISQSDNSKSQSFSSFEPNERAGILWDEALNNFRNKNSISIKKFRIFERFETTPYHVLKADIMKNARKENLNLASLEGTEKDAEKGLDLLYDKFLNTEKEYPSSVEELRYVDSTYTPCDSTGCTNINFDQGTLNTWYGWYGENESTVTTRIINDITGGLLGSVTEACNDPNTLTYYNTDDGCSPVRLSNDYQLSITSSGNDVHPKSISMVNRGALRNVGR